MIIFLFSWPRAGLTTMLVNTQSAKRDGQQPQAILVLLLPSLKNSCGEGGGLSLFNESFPNEDATSASRSLREGPTKPPWGWWVKPSRSLYEAFSKSPWSLRSPRSFDEAPVKSSRIVRHGAIASLLREGFMKPPWALCEDTALRWFHQDFVAAPRSLREAVAEPLRRRLPTETPRVLHEAFAGKPQCLHEATLGRCLHKALTVASWSLHVTGSLWRRGEGFARTSRALHEDFADCEDSMVASRRLCEVFAKASPSPTGLRGVFSKASRGARGVFIWKRFVK